MGGGQTPVNLGLLLVKRVHWIGTTLRARPIEQKVALSQRFISEVIPLFESGALRPVIDSRYALEDDRRRPPADGRQRQRRQDPDRSLIDR